MSSSEPFRISSRKRKSFSNRERAEIFRDTSGICHLCQRPIGPGEEWDVEHVTPKGLGGSDDPENLRPAHVDCHRGPGGKTSDDRAKMAKADRLALKAAGLWKSKTPMRRR
jgi:5-methylcytosine-specific restriction endonuclease McrA